MGNLIKYELKGNYKLFLGLFLITTIVNGFLYTRIDAWASGAPYALMILATSVMFVMVLIFNIGFFSKEIHEDRGYLTFTLPVSGNKITGAKIIVALIWSAAATLLAIATFTLVGQGKYDWDIIRSVVEKVNVPLIIILAIVGWIGSSLQLLTTAYFSITASRVAIGKKKMGKFIGFVLFIVLSTTISYAEGIVATLIPYRVNLPLGFGPEDAAFGNGIYMMTQGIGQGASINIAVSIYYILVIIGLFIGTGYLIDNKIDL